jgi:hypothetical protein
MTPLNPTPACLSHLDQRHQPPHPREVATIRGMEADLAHALALVARLKAEIKRSGDEERRPRRWRHKKRGTIYTEVCRAELQAATHAPEEGELMVVYRGEDGCIWVRASGEFNDGRFEYVTNG